MTSKTSDGKYYCYTFTGTTPVNIIWNNGNGTQTSNLTFEQNAIYSPAGNTGKTYDGSTDDGDNTDDDGNTDDIDPNGYGLMDNIQDGVILHCFDWTAAQVEAEIVNIAKAGFTAVQLSPVHEREGASAWYMAYQPYDFKVGNSIASVKSLTSLCNAAHKVGVKVIVDVIANHTNGGLEWVAERLRDHLLYHNDPTTMNEINYNSRYSITHDDMGIQGIVRISIAEDAAGLLYIVSEPELTPFYQNLLLRISSEVRCRLTDGRAETIDEALALFLSEAKHTLPPRRGATSLL